MSQWILKIFAIFRYFMWLSTMVGGGGWVRGISIDSLTPTSAHCRGSIPPQYIPISWINALECGLKLRICNFVKYVLCMTRIWSVVHSWYGGCGIRNFCFLALNFFHCDETVSQFCIQKMIKAVDSETPFVVGCTLNKFPMCRLPWINR